MQDGGFISLLATGNVLDDEALQQAIIDGANHLIIATDAAGTILDMNPAAEMALGYACAEVVGKATPEIFHDPEEVATYAQRLRDELGCDIQPGFAVLVAKAARGLRDERECLYIRKDGSRFPVLLSVTPLHDRDGSLTGFVGISTDLSLRKAQERALLEAQIERKARAEAERSSAMKSRFLAAASHDLRQPLQAVTLFLNVLQMREKDPDLRVIIDKAMEALRIGDGLLGSMAEIANLDAGLVRPKLMSFPAQSVLDPLLAQTAMRARENGLTLRHVSSTAKVVSDPVMLQRVVAFLLDNAIRHTQDGRVLVGCRRRGAEVAIAIHDTGPGIPEDKIDLIFEDFFQVGNPSRDRTQGLGLGLPIAQRLIRALGHRIVVRSRLGLGSTFAIVVPADLT